MFQKPIGRGRLRGGRIIPSLRRNSEGRLEMPPYPRSNMPRIVMNQRVDQQQYRGSPEGSEYPEVNQQRSLLREEPHYHAEKEPTYPESRALTDFRGPPSPNYTLVPYGLPEEAEYGETPAYEAGAYAQECSATTYYETPTHHTYAADYPADSTRYERFISASAYPYPRYPEEENRPQLRKTRPRVISKDSQNVEGYQGGEEDRTRGDQAICSSEKCVAQTEEDGQAAEGVQYIEGNSEEQEFQLFDRFPPIPKGCFYCLGPHGFRSCPDRDQYGPICHLCGIHGTEKYQCQRDSCKAKIADETRHDELPIPEFVWTTGIPYEDQVDMQKLIKDFIIKLKYEKKVKVVIMDLK